MNTPFGSELEVFLNAYPNDTASLPNTFDNVWYSIATDAFTSEAFPALWFYGSAVSMHSSRLSSLLTLNALNRAPLCYHSP